MKTLFFQHFKISTEEYQRIWGEALIAIDTNIIINLYRYSETTRKELLEILTSFPGRVWLPNRVAEEYFKNRLSTLGAQAKAYDTSRRSLENVLDEFKNQRQHPFISSHLLDEFTAVTDKIFQEMEKSSTAILDQFSNDYLLESIINIVSDNVGEAYTEDDLKKIYKEGEIRFSSKTPPGYMDGNKKDERDPNIKYGDLVIWNQLIDKARSSTTPIIFVTDDKKEDWWLEQSGRTIGPQPSLIKEFKEKALQDILIYKPDQFVTYAQKFLQQQVNEQVVTELRNFPPAKSEVEVGTQYVTPSNNFQPLYFEIIRLQNSLFMVQLHGINNLVLLSSRLTYNTSHDCVMLIQMIADLTQFEDRYHRYFAEGYNRFDLYTREGNIICHGYASTNASDVDFVINTIRSTALHTAPQYFRDLMNN